MRAKRKGLCGSGRKSTDNGLVMVGFLERNGTYSNKMVTIPTGRYRAVGIVFGRYRSLLYLRKSDYT
jgi:hypothetical protein